jgi:MFS family permease
MDAQNTMLASPASSSRKSVKFLFGMTSLMLGANLVWVSYSAILLPTLVENVVAERKGIYVGMIGFFGTLIAMIVSILFGVISDHTSSKWGKRTPAILTGAVLALPLIGLPTFLLSPAFGTMFLPLALPIIVISYFGMQFFTNMGNGAWWPLLVDVVPENQRGFASGIQGFMALIGSAVGILLVTGLNQRGQTGSALWIVGGILALTGIINARVIRGKDQPAAPSQQIRVYRAVRDMFKVRTRVVVFFWLVLAVLLANMGINSLQFFARYFFEVYFPGISPDAAFRLMGGISLVMTMLSAIGSGFLSDKIGRRSLILYAMIVCAVTTLGMGLTHDFTLFLILTALRSIAIGPILASAPALASDLSPREEAGQYMAYNNLSTSLSTALSALIFGFVLASMTKTSFMYVFILSAILFLLGGILFSIKVSQKALDDQLMTSVDEMGDLARIKTVP